MRKLILKEVPNYGPQSHGKTVYEVVRRINMAEPSIGTLLSTAEMTRYVAMTAELNSQLTVEIS